jgi:hypothetical protein
VPDAAASRIDQVFDPVSAIRSSSFVATLGLPRLILEQLAGHEIQ